MTDDDTIGASIRRVDDRASVNSMANRTAAKDDSSITRITSQGSSRLDNQNHGGVGSSNTRQKGRGRREHSPDDMESSSDSSSSIDKRGHSKKHKHKSHRRHHRKSRKRDSSQRRRGRRHHNRRSNSWDSSSTCSTNDNDDDDNEDYNRRRRRRKERKHKKKRHRREYQDDESHDSHGSVNQNHSLNGLDYRQDNRDKSAALQMQNEVLISQLYEILSKYPDLATELPYFLIRLASGSSINLSQVSDPELVRLLEKLFYTLKCTCEEGKSNNTSHCDREWSLDTNVLPTVSVANVFSNNLQGHDKELCLLRWIRYEMDALGITMEKVHHVESAMVPAPAPTPASYESMESRMPSMENEIASLTRMVLEEFSTPLSNQESSSYSLAKELYDIFHMILQHEIVSLDGLENEMLRKSLHQLFLAIGLCREEMEQDSDNDICDGGGGGGVEHVVPSQVAAFGYVMPEQEEMGQSDNVLQHVQRNLDAAMNACKAMHQEWVIARQQSLGGKRMLGPCRPAPLTSMASSHENGMAAYPSNEHHASGKRKKEADDDNDNEDEDEVGPVPASTLMSSSRSSSMSSKRNREPQSLPSMRNHGSSLSKTAQTLSDVNQREEWMIKPGEPDFLKGILSKGIKNRTFRNEKRGDPKADTMTDTPLDPKIQRQVDEIMKLHQEARGPSLMEQHRERIAQEKMSKMGGTKGNWSWNREKDLDAGRRVDKAHLHMVMGGASSELKNKFQGSYSKNFD